MLLLVSLAAMFLLVCASLLRRVPPGLAAVVVDGDRCLSLPTVGGWTVAVPGRGHFARVEIGRTRVAYPTSWHELPDGVRVRLGMIVGLTVDDPCLLLSEGLLGMREGQRAGAPDLLAIDADGIVRYLQDAMPSLLADVLTSLSPDADAPVASMAAWLQIRRKLVVALTPVGLTVQEVTLHDVTVDVPVVAAPTSGGYPLTARRTPRDERPSPGAPSPRPPGGPAPRTRRQPGG